MNATGQFATSIEEIANVIALEEWAECGYADSARFRNRVLKRMRHLSDDVPHVRFKDLVMIGEIDEKGTSFFIHWEVEPPKEDA